jgi:hypothetical protein
MQKRKEEIITFKVDEKMSRAMSGVENRSAFIRNAILAALGNTCPVCKGSGIVSESQQTHWNDFLSHHHIEECADCNETRLVCDFEKKGKGA